MKLSDLIPSPLLHPPHTPEQEAKMPGKKPAHDWHTVQDGSGISQVKNPNRSFTQQFGQQMIIWWLSSIDLLFRAEKVTDLEPPGPEPPGAFSSQLGFPRCGARMEWPLSHRSPFSGLELTSCPAHLKKLLKNCCYNFCKAREGKSFLPRPTKPS